MNNIKDICKKVFGLFEKNSVIRKEIKNGKTEYVLYSKDMSRVLMRSPSKKAVEEHEKMVNKIKHMKKDSGIFKKVFD